MDYLLICLVAFLGSALTLFSGFGLGTLLLPVFGLFFPIEVAIALTAVVHFLNNLFKLVLLGRGADRSVVLQFGLPSIGAALLGAWLLSSITARPPLFTYFLMGRSMEVTPLKLTIGLLLLLFALFEVMPALKKVQFSRRYLPLGGVLSGFFGGLSGHQGALRSAFLIRAGLSKEAFIATGVVIACLIDISRLFLYSTQIFASGEGLNYSPIGAATLSAFAGAFLGNRLLRKVTISFVQGVVAVMIFLFALLLMAGIV